MAVLAGGWQALGVPGRGVLLPEVINLTEQFEYTYKGIMLSLGGLCTRSVADGSIP